VRTFNLTQSHKVMHTFTRFDVREIYQATTRFSVVSI
jgi:hypothetical protein